MDHSTIKLVRYWFILFTTQLITAEEIILSLNCPSSSSSCATLFNFVPPSSSNLILNLESGIHSLASLTLMNRNGFTLMGEFGSTTINCAPLSQNTINLRLRAVSNVIIRGITFIGCNLEFQQCNNTDILHSTSFDGSNGAMEFDSCFNVSIDSSTFGNNQDSSFGGVIEFSRTSGIKISRSNFHNNNVSSFGSVVLFSRNSSGVIACCNFSNNYADSFGGIVQSRRGESKFKIINSTFIENEVSSFGGVIRLDSSNDVATVVSSVFKYNTASSFGGVVNLDDGGIVNILASEFSHNRAGSSGGSINSRRSGNVTVDCTHFLNNSASSDTAINVGESSFLTLSNSSACQEEFEIGEKAIIGGCRATFQANATGDSRTTTSSTPTTIKPDHTAFQANVTIMGSDSQAATSSTPTTIKPDHTAFQANVTIMGSDSQAATSSTPTTTKLDQLSAVSSTVTAVSVCVVAIVMALSGFFVGLLVMWCWIKRKAKKQPMVDPSSSSDPVYDTVTTPPYVDLNFKLHTNKCYGYNTKVKH